MCYSSFMFVEKYFQYSGCHLIKVRNVCTSSNINVSWIFLVFKAGRFLKEATKLWFQEKILPEKRPPCGFRGKVRFRLGIGLSLWLGLGLGGFFPWGFFPRTRNCILCISRVWTLFCSVWLNISLHFLHIILEKLGFRLSVF